MKSANFFCLCFILDKKKMLTDKATIKIEIEDGREVPKFFLILQKSETFGYNFL